MFILSITYIMKTCIILCSIFACAYGATLRIVGGENATIRQFPFIVSLRRTVVDKHVCGGTIIGPRAILTAAHCKVSKEDTVVIVGTHKLNNPNAKIHNIESFTIHDNYTASTLTNDVAIILVTEDISFDNLVQTGQLASEPISDNERLTTAGWGVTSHPSTNASNDLLFIQTNTLSRSKCFSMTGIQELDGKICTFESIGIGICSGDSGGPLINVRNEIVGIASMVYKCARGRPDIFTDVFYFKDWIIEHANI